MAGRKAPERGQLVPFDELSRNEQLRRLQRGDLEPEDTRGKHPHPPVPLTHPWRTGLGRRGNRRKEE